MCGIAGAFYFDPARPVDSKVLAAMSGAIAHRGPDAEGFWTEPGIGLAHRRLSIIDLAGGDQPLANEDGSVHVVFNGEIYNYQEIRADLLKRGHQFRTQSDTEVLVHLYEEMGDNLVERLRGMFAFALWDRRNKRLLLARDRLGIKPLYYYHDAEKLLFASEIKGILAHPNVPRELDHAALEDYLAYGMVLGPRSIFRNIHKLQPACTLSVSSTDAALSPKKYWQLRIEPDHKPTVEEWQEAIEAKLAESVKLHLIADVPVGAFLSGGIDSSAIVAMTHGKTNGPLRTFSIGFAEQAWSELPAARQVAKAFQTEHTEQIITPDTIALLDDLSHYYDEPFADSSALPTFLVSKLASQHVKVVLSGDGGDECFGGYARYAHDLKEASVRRWLPGWFRRTVLGSLASAWPKADWLPRPLRMKSALTNLSLQGDAAYANTLSLCRSPLRRQLLSPDLRAQLNGHEPGRLIREYYCEPGSNHPLDGMLAADIHSMLPDDFLVKVDRASMAHGLEVRPPLLDHELMGLAARIPADYKVHQGETKWIFKQTVRDRLPADLLTRPKQGFELPVADWLRESLRPVFEEAVLSNSAAVSSLVDQALINKIYQQHVSARQNHGSTLWSLLVLARWVERYLSPSSTLTS